MTDKAKWLAGLQKSDGVVVHWARHARTRLQTVARMSDTLIVVDNGLRFRWRDGYDPGDTGTSFHWIEKPTPAQARKAKA